VKFDGWANSDPDAYPTAQILSNIDGVGVRGGQCICPNTTEYWAGEWVDKPGT